MSNPIDQILFILQILSKKNSIEKRAAIGNSYPSGPRFLYCDVRSLSTCPARQNPQSLFCRRIVKPRRWSFAAHVAKIVGDRIAGEGFVVGLADQISNGFNVLSKIAGRILC